MKTKNNEEFIHYLYQLTGYIQYEINVTRKMCEEECSVLEAGRRKGKLETLEDMLINVSKIIEKYFETHKPGDTIQFWRACCKFDVPFITVEEKRAYSLVSWDCISLSAIGQERINNSADIAVQQQELYRQYSLDPSYARFVDPFVGYIRTEKERAPELAEKLYDILMMRVGADRTERPFPLGVRQAW